MKNVFKTLICALTLTAAIAAVPAMVSARDNKDVYVSDTGALMVYEQADANSDLVFYANGYGYEIHVQDYLNGFGYAYVPYFGVTGWVNLSDCYLAGELDTDEVLYGNEILHSWVDSGFLALRFAPAFDDGNIIAEIWSNGTTLMMTGDYSGNYGYCYVPAFDMYGWVDVRFTY